MKNAFLKGFKCIGLLMLMFTFQIDILSGEISNVTNIRLAGHFPSNSITNSLFLKKLDANKSVPITFILPLRNQEELEQLIGRLHDPNDLEYYGKYITPEEFVERFAPTQEDYDKVITYAKGVGLNVGNKQPNRTLLNVKGDVKSIEKAFKLNLYQYRQPDGRKFYAPDNNPAVPTSIAAVISGVVGLDNLAVWKPLHRRHESDELVSNVEAQAFPSGPGGGFSPDDLKRAYNLSGLSTNGSGQIIALFELAGYQVSDITAYTNKFGLPPANLRNILVNGGSNSGINAEVTLDIQLALALAPASQIYVYEGPNSAQGVLDTYNRIATDNAAKQVSTSWGLGEDLSNNQFLQAENAIFMQMAAQGQSIYAAAGDSGAYDDYPSRTLVVDDPASQPYVTGVGGTTLNVNSTTGGYESESVWDNGVGNGAGGGGVSKLWPIPSWQSNVPTVYSTTHRNVPDISLNADTNTGYAIYYNGQWQIYGGTSCAAPLWAAFNANVNQQLTTNQKPVLGFVNPLIYKIGLSSEAANFHDITIGNNLYYPCHSGYDNATGWGSFNGGNLFATLSNSNITPPPPENHSPILNVSISHGGVFKKGGTGIYRINVSNKGNYPTTGPVTLTVTLPSGLSYKANSAPGWTFDKNKLTFKRSSVLNPNSAYPQIVLSVSVSRSASSSLTAIATVSGGGSISNTDTDPTVIN